MLIGPFWCVESNAWLRFNVTEENGVLLVTPELSYLDEKNPALSKPWEPTPENTWHVVDASADSFEHAYYRIENRGLYRCFGVNRLTGNKMVSSLTIVDGKPTWHPGRFTSFDLYAMPTNMPSSPLPITPEQQTEQQTKLWETLKETNFFIPHFVEQIDSEFTEAQRYELIASLLDNPLLEFKAYSYETFQDYLAVLRAIICDPNHPLHSSIKNQAARTVDYPTLEGSTISELHKKKSRFFLEYLTIIYNYIRQQFGLEEERLLEEFQIAPAAPQRPLVQPNIHLQEHPIRHELKNTELRQTIIRNLDSLFNGDQRQELLSQLENCLEDFLSQDFITERAYSEALRQIISNEDNPLHEYIEALSYNTETLADRQLGMDINLQPLKAQFFLEVLQLELDHTNLLINPRRDAPPFREPRPAPIFFDEPAGPPHLDIPDIILGDIPLAPIDPHLTPRLEDVQTAVRNAQRKYSEWYSGQEPHRGKNGYFTWLRHGPFGQERAKRFKNEVMDIQDVPDAINKINRYLIDPKTPAHRHSFLSFLVDEVKPIPQSPWAQIQFKSTLSNLYNKKEVVDACSMMLGR